MTGIKQFIDNNRRRILPALLVLVVLTAVTLPLAFSPAWAAPATAPDRVLTYSVNRLTWDSAASIRPDGSAVLPLFSANYPNVASNDGSNVVAPGTDGHNTVRLKNNVGGTIQYTAVLYAIKSNPAVPVTPALSGSYLTDTTRYSLPAGVDKSNVIRAVSGSVRGFGLQDLDIDWLWNYYVSDVQDGADTDLGNAAAHALSTDSGELVPGVMDNITVGLYIVVEDNNTYYYPKTGDDAPLALYAALMTAAVISTVSAVVVYKKRKNNAE